MPAYEVFRAERQPPFEWRQATFQKMRLAVPEGPAANKLTADPAVIQDVILTLRDGATAAPFSIETAGGTGNVHSLLLWSDELPGLVFSPAVYFDPAGRVYLAENLAAVEFEVGHVPGLAFFAMEQELSEILGRKVDLNTPQFLSRYFRDTVLAEAEDQYAA